MEFHIICPIDSEYTLYGFYGVLAIVFLLYYLMIFMKWKIGLQLLIGFSEVLILILTVIFYTQIMLSSYFLLDPCFSAICSIGMHNPRIMIISRLTIFQIITSDVCMQPSATILSRLTGDAYKFASYYFDCTGTNPVTNYLNTAHDILNNYPANLTQQVYAKLQRFNNSPSYHQCLNGDFNT